MRLAFLLCLFTSFAYCTIACGEPLPSSFDLRDLDGNSYIGAVRDQGSCGSCYSFGSLAAAESTWNRAHDLYDDRAIDLSESFMVWSLSPLYQGLNGCDGGNATDPMNALTEYGMPLESVFPYTTTDPGEDLHWDAERYPLLDWYHIPPNDIETTKRVLQSIGAVRVSIYGDREFIDYSRDIFTNDDTAINSVIPYYSSSNHAVALVGWNDEPGDDGLGYWILRNSWGDTWGEDGYMNIRYTSAGVNRKSSYLIAALWDGESISLENNDDLTAVPWSAGGTRNAHGVDLWGGLASSVTNRGMVLAHAVSDSELATARGVYLWGGAGGQVINEHGIGGFASSQNNQAIAYAICLQGGLVDNRGMLMAFADSPTDQAMAFGVWAANGGSAVEIRNSGEVVALAGGGQGNAAYGLWADSRKLAAVTNSGTINAVADRYAVGTLLSGGPSELVNDGIVEAFADRYAIGVLLSDGPSELVNDGTIRAATLDPESGEAFLFIAGIYSSEYASIDNSGIIKAEADLTTPDQSFTGIFGIKAGSNITIYNSGIIEAEASATNPELWSPHIVGIEGDDKIIILNSGTIRGASASVNTGGETALLLTTGSDLVGRVHLGGVDDLVMLVGHGSEDEVFDGGEHLVMVGSDWSLSGDSVFDTILVAQGRLGLDGALAGDAAILAGGIIGGNGSLTGRLTNYGTVAPGHSVGHLTIDGDFVQDPSGILEIEIGDGVADQLSVSGRAALAGTLQVLPDGYATDGSYTFLEADTIEGAFEHLASVAVLDVSLDSPVSGSLTLDVLRNSYVSLAAAHNRGLADSLDGLRPTAADDLGELLDSLDLTLSPAALNDALASLTPRIHGLSSAAALGDAQARLTDLRRRLQRLDPAQNPVGITSAWFEMLGQYNRYRSDGGYFGARQNLYGLLFGVERTARSGLNLGLAAAVSETRLEAYGAADDGESESQQGYLYAAWSNPHRAGGLHLNGVLGAGRTELSAERGIPFAGRRAHSEHNGTLVSATISGGYAMNLGGWTIDPSAGLSFVRLREESFGESGADSADLKISARDNDSLQSLVGLRLSRPVDLPQVTLKPELRIEWRHEFDRHTESLQTRLVGTTSHFDTPGRDLAGDSLLLGATLQAQLSDTAFGSLSYDCDLQNGSATAHVLRLQLGMAF